MVETDWREILSFSQRELRQADKEKLCESLSWMEADDIELNFSDLKTLFRLAQDIMKYKSEQVNNLLAQQETSNRKGGKKKSKIQNAESPASTESGLESITHQEELIKGNKEILEQLYTDIADLEGKKKKLESDKPRKEDSDSSRDALSEINAVAQLENEVAMKNRHIRKLLTDVKVLEEENTKFKDKTYVLKVKLTEATQLIDNLTEQLLLMNNESSHLKDILGKSEQDKAKLSCEIETLRKEFFEKESTRENIYEEIKSKAQHWKNIAKVKKSELEALSVENEKLKENLNRGGSKSSSPKVVKDNFEERKIKELQDKLTEASNEIDKSANLINLLRAENRQLKSIVEETQEQSVSDYRNESDEGKERILINKLKKKVNGLTIDLQGAEEMVAVRERELAEVASELQLVQSDEGIHALLNGLKHKKRELKIKDENLKSLIQEINRYSQQVNDLQLENETLRQKLNIPVSETICTDGVVKKYRDLESSNSEMCKEIRRLENKLVNVEVANRNNKSQIIKLTNLLHKAGYNKQEIVNAMQESDGDIPREDDEEISRSITKHNEHKNNDTENNVDANDAETKAIMEENEGLRKGLQEILDFLKDNSTTSSGILALECPSLETLLRSMEARHSAGWFSPHMSTIMELRAAMGGKDALLKALHQARKETFDIMSQLSKETLKSSELERKLQDLESKNKEQQKDEDIPSTTGFGEFGSWIAEKEQIGIDVSDENKVKEMIAKGNTMYEGQLKKGLEYFHKKFKLLHDKITLMAVQAADDQNKWSLQEEHYKAQIENLKGQIQQQEDEDISENSPGLISLPSSNHLQRKCTYLEESYKYIRTLNENLKNENLEAKKEIMSLSSEYEAEIQVLILSVANLTDRLRSSLPIELFWKQNESLSENITKYRKVVENSVKNKTETIDLISRLENNKFDIINSFRMEFNGAAKQGNKSTEGLLLSIEESVLKRQIHELCIELNTKDKKIEYVENKNTELQEAQSKIIDNSLASLTKQDIELMKVEIQTLADENKVLKDKSQHVSSQLEIALLQLQEHQQRQMSNDMEVNILRHQILDLQSTSDNKAILARLSGEVLVAHLQVTESNKKIDRLTTALNKEKELRVESEEMLKARQKIFDVYSFRYESKFRFIFEVMQVLRQQYQGSIPVTSIENYLNKLEDITRESQVVNEKLQEIEDLRSNLMTKHSVFDHILDVSRNRCIIEVDSCPHKIKTMMIKSTKSREIEHINKKLQIMEQSRDDILKRYNNLEKTLVLVNQGFEKSNINGDIQRKQSDGEINMSNLELEDVQSDDDSTSRKSKTVSLPQPQILKPLKSDTNKNNENAIPNISQNAENIPIETNKNPVAKPRVANIEVQTMPFERQIQEISVQTAEDQEILRLKENIQSLNKKIEKHSRELAEALSLVQQRTKENLVWNTEKINLEASIQTLKSNNNYKERLNSKLQSDIEELQNELDKIRALHATENSKTNDVINNENKSLLMTIKQLENDKNMVSAEYKELLNNEREEYSKTIKDLHVKNMELQSKLDRKGSDSNGLDAEALKEVVSKYTMKIVELEDRCFKLQSELDECKTELTTYQSEVDRWKDLATERLSKMEQLNAQLGERHFQEVESYKAENQHWLTQLNDTQREHMELRTRLTEQKAVYQKQLSEKDGQIEQMRSVINNLKAQVMNMQTMISVNDPSFDLSAIVEVDEASDALSHGCERLEIKFDFSGDVNDLNDEFGRIGNSSTSICPGSVESCEEKNIWFEDVVEEGCSGRGKPKQSWMDCMKDMGKKGVSVEMTADRAEWKRKTAKTSGHKVMRQEPVIDRLRRDKQMAGKQNAILRRQIKALASRERRARLDAQNLKNQVFRISTSGSKVATAETAALHNKIASLQAQLTSARRDTNSSIALWDKWKRAQQAADRWQARYEEKCQEVKKLEHCIDLSKSAVNRLEKEKKVLLSRLTHEHEKQLSIEKQESEPQEKVREKERECSTCANAPPLSNHALLERVQAQQRRIAVLEVAEKGNEILVSEYERALAEITSLKGQVLKLESTLLESQIRTPMHEHKDSQPELDYWKNYCEMLKEENVQLNLRVNALETTPTTAHQHRVNNLEQTVLTLRGLVSKLQSEQKTSPVHRKVDSRPSSGRSDKSRSHGQLEPNRIEIANLKRSIQEKDLLLERSKEMLKIAAEREDDLLRENAFLRRQLEDLTNPKQGFLSA